MLARGTTENYPGLLGTLTNKILDAIPGSDYENIIYPATQEGSTPSYGEGIRNGTAQLKRYASVCPNSKIVLFGYSQGAMVVGDMLAGGGDNGTLGAFSQPTVNSRTLGSHITAIVLYGDPRHMPDQPYNVGDVTATGKDPRTDNQLRALSAFNSRIHHFCDNKDGVCDAAGTNLSAHMAYVTTWDNTAASWVVDMIQRQI
ncbi:hypothetical protein MYU51_019509 [Penicillium brevicompactum]|uniref:uncharacterized protein n=1 Tax=Penicillium brevicompactum TaxID=5074 RepID=UPI002541A661|nr:uncharacterized protein N7506_008201 [Penicillium brevicompactum]KAJ5334418.1 hypothetical protein N7506_008201 [Penicillium brevicompactum]